MYFSPYKKTSDAEIPTSGKLWDHYCYKKKRLRGIGLLADNKSKKVPSISEATSEGKIIFILQINIYSYLHDMLLN